MSFRGYARRVRDPRLPHRRRVAALRSCVQLYRPIGFTVTLDYLEATAGRYRRDERALLRALEALEASRGLWQAEVRAYTEARREAKRRGRRRPAPDVPNPHVPDRWYGAVRRAALHAVRYHRTRRGVPPANSPDPVVRDVERCVDACLENAGRLTPEQRRLVAACRERLRERLRLTSRTARSEYFEVRALLTVLRHVEAAADAPDEGPVRISRPPRGRGGRRAAAG
ncbi:hypothetical protein [Marinitenerispora sediminis]|uniref:hypothetical protein n=1 Tax=Marinitenerispora sediminis TaxID=1931232 RepID=UPI0015F18B56|nr:hypothetical protein [Marinitenerispora sediminis]